MPLGALAMRMFLSWTLVLPSGNDTHSSSCNGLHLYSPTAIPSFSSMWRGCLKWASEQLLGWPAESWAVAYSGSGHSVQFDVDSPSAALCTASRLFVYVIKDHKLCLWFLLSQALSEFFNLITGVWGMSDHTHTLKCNVFLSLWEGHLAGLLFFTVKSCLWASCLETSNLDLLATASALCL